METFKVIVRKCNVPTYWYADKVGQVFECHQRGIYYQVDGLMYGCTNYLLIEDCIPCDLIGYKPIKKLNFI